MPFVFCASFVCFHRFRSMVEKDCEVSAIFCQHHSLPARPWRGSPKCPELAPSSPSPQFFWLDWVGLGWTAGKVQSPIDPAKFPAHTWPEWLRLMKLNCL